MLFLYRDLFHYRFCQTIEPVLIPVSVGDSKRNGLLLFKQSKTEQIISRSDSSQIQFQFFHGNCSRVPCAIVQGRERENRFFSCGIGPIGFFLDIPNNREQIRDFLSSFQFGFPYLPEVLGGAVQVRNTSIPDDWRNIQ